MLPNDKNKARELMKYENMKIPSEHTAKSPIFSIRLSSVQLSQSNAA